MFRAACARAVILRQGLSPAVLGFSNDINERGYRYSFYLGDGCTGCGICFYNCPEPEQ